MKNKLIIAATLALAMAFTFGCSSDDNSGGDGPSTGGGDTQGSCPNAVTGNNTVTCGGKTYKTVQIDGQTWMAENLNYNVSGSTCYGEGRSGVSADSIANNCAKYGRLYNWATAMALPPSCNTSFCSVNSKHRGICPAGWHIPSDAEWDTLITFAGGVSRAGSKLKAASGWNNNRNGKDNYGFTALPGGRGLGGYGYSSGEYDSAGDIGFWWSASEHEATNDSSPDFAYSWNISSSDYVERTNTQGKTHLYSIRCLKD